MLAQLQPVARPSRDRYTTSSAGRANTGTTARDWLGWQKNSISICSNSRVRNVKLRGVISLRKLLPIWAMPNGIFTRRAVADVFEIDEHALGRFGAQKCRVFFAAQRADDRFEHQVEIARRGQLALFELARMLARLQRAFAGGNVIDAEAAFAAFGAAIDHLVDEQIVMARSTSRPAGA